MRAPRLMLPLAAAWLVLGGGPAPPVAWAAEPSNVQDSPPAADVLVVCPDALRPGLLDWQRRRQQEGLVVQVVTPAADSTTTRSRIAGQAIVGTTRYVLLVGDAQLVSDGSPAAIDAYLPTIYQRADATAAYQLTPYLPGDYRYGDFDDDGVIDASVGRWPVRHVNQVRSLIQRIAAYEDSQDFGRWRSRVDLVAGLGGFGFVVDRTIETVAGSMITGSLPGAVRTRITHAGPDSLFSPGPTQFTNAVLQNYDDGARFWVYAGHGLVEELDRVPATADGRPVLSLDDLPQLNRDAQAAPIALLLACYTGAFDAPQDCLAKGMFLTDGGPVAVLAGSRVTMPYGNAAVTLGLIESVYHRQPTRLGDAWRETLLEMASPSDADEQLQSRRALIDRLATVLGDGRIEQERREHMQLYNWFGDPTLRLTHPQPLPLQAAERAIAGQVVEVSGHAPFAGQLTVELHRRLGTSADRTTIVNRPRQVDRMGSTESDRPAAGSPLPLIPDDYWFANETAVQRVQLDLPATGSWTVRLTIPDTAGGQFRLLADLESPAGFASGSRNLWVRPAIAAAGQR